MLLHSHVFVITLDFTRHFYSFYQPWPLKIFNLVPHCFFVSSSEIRQNCEIFFAIFSQINSSTSQIPLIAILDDKQCEKKVRNFDFKNCLPFLLSFKFQSLY